MTATSDDSSMADSQFEGFPDADNAREQVVEAALFASAQPLSLERLQVLFGDEAPVSKTEIRGIIARLQERNDSRGVELVKVAGGYRFQTKRGLHPWLSRLWDEKPKKYSRALMETLALIAYRQPITRGEIEDVRGVSVASNIIRTLLEREWVRVVGHRDVPGRPALFATTQQFLDYFGLGSLDELPPLSEIKSMAELEPELDLETGLEGEADSSSFASMLSRLQDEDSDGEEGNLDAELSEQWETLDELNDQFETGLRQQPDDSAEAADAASVDPAEAGEAKAADADSAAREAELTEAEQLAIIQNKLAAQANLLQSDGTDDDTETDPQTSRQSQGPDEG